MNVKFVLIAFVLSLLIFSNHSYAQNSGQVVILETGLGQIVIELFPNDAPKTVENFLKLTNDGFYNDLVFHRIIKDFMIQSGDPLTKDPTTESTWGLGNAGYNLEAEFNNIKHDRGIVSMARSMDPNSASSQFFIVHKDSNFLDQQYTVFGRIVTQESYDTLDAIAALETGDRDIPIDRESTKILNAKVVQGSEISDMIQFGEPKRVGTPLAESSDTTYTNNKLGISFSAPAGWLIQEPHKRTADVPDVIVVGPNISEINPVISVNVVFRDISIDEKLAETKATIQPALDDGSFQIISEEKITIHGNEAYELEVLGFFERGNSTYNMKFKEVLIATPEKFYTLTYTNEEQYFENHLQAFQKLIDSFTVLAVPEQISTTETPEGGGCLIATATFGSEFAPQVQQLREIRDNFLTKTESGSAFMKSFNQFYYSFSPTIADLERENPAFKEMVKLVITPLLTSLSILNYVDMYSEAEVLGYGISLILLNVGMYFVVPTVIIFQTKKRFDH